MFQDHNLIDYLTPPKRICAWSIPKADMKILEDLGLSREESKRNIMHLSGGQRQRVAVGRAPSGARPRDSGGRTDWQPGSGND